MAVAMRGGSGRGSTGWAVWVALWGGAFLRSWRLGAKSLWLDEALVLQRMSVSLADFAAGQGEPYHPPFYYEFMRFWTGLLGASEVAVRLPSVLFGTAGLALFYLLARRLLGRDRALTALWLAALSPLLIWYAQEARTYSILMFLHMGSSLALVGAAVRSRTTLFSWWWLLLAAGLTTGLYLHYAAILIIPFHLLLLTILLVQRRTRWPAFFVYGGAWAATGLAFWPWWQTPAMQGFVGIFLSDRFYLAPVISRLTGLSYTASVQGAMLGGLFAVPLGLVLLYRLLRRYQRPLLALAGRPAVQWGTALLFVGGLLLIVYPRAYSFKRQLAPLFPLLLLLPAWMWPLKRGSGSFSWRRPLAVVLIASSLAALVNLTLIPKAAWREVTRDLISRHEPGDAVLPVPGYLNILIDYYDPDGVLEVVSVGQPLTDSLTGLAGGHARIWYIEHEADRTGPREEVSEWLESHMRPAGSWDYYLLNVRLYEKTPEPAAD